MASRPTFAEACLEDDGLRMRDRGEWVTDFLRYHVLIRVFDGDAAAWLDVLSQKQASAPDMVFVEWIGDRLRAEPQLLTHLRELVDSSGLWPAPDDGRHAT